MSNPADTLTAATERLIAAQCNMMLTGMLSMSARSSQEAKAGLGAELEAAKQHYRATVAALLPASAPAPAEEKEPADSQAAFQRGMEHAFSLVLAALRGDAAVAFPGNMDTVLGALEYHRKEIATAAYISNLSRLDDLILRADKNKIEAVEKGRAYDSIIWEDRASYLRHARGALQEQRAIYRHTPSARLYSHLGELLYQGSEAQQVMVAYADYETRRLYVSPKDEFDAYFELVMPE